MLTSLAEWRTAIAQRVDDGCWPARRDLGARYPWRTVYMHAASDAYRRRWDATVQALSAQAPGRWVAAISGGKDSMALALALAAAGWRPQAMTLRHDRDDYPGMREYVLTSCRALSLQVDVLDVDIQVPAGASLEEVYRQSAVDFRAARDAYQADVDGVLLGLRAAESYGRRVNRRVRGLRYRRASGLEVWQPLADWTALDVHAAVAMHGVPLHPVYMCIDDGADWLSIREDGWMSSGWPANLGHYAWLRRWWPRLWLDACAIDPAVRLLS